MLNFIIKEVNMFVFIHHYVLLNEIVYKCFSLKTTEQFIGDNPQTLGVKRRPRGLHKRENVLLKSSESQHLFG